MEKKLNGKKQLNENEVKTMISGNITMISGNITMTQGKVYC